jgi:tRNA(Ile)-lysidine synthase
MLHEFLKFIEDNRLIKKNDRVLLAVSGGIDSMVMTDLFIKSGIDIGIAHCNFTLRAEESDRDEELVREFAADHNIPFYSQRFDTKTFSEDKRISIQMAARNLRYSWFEEIRKQNRYNSIAVAHNLNDNIETFLINLARGTGIAGLSGMKKAGNRVIRPMLFASRQSIEEYCRNRNIFYREDSSNAETKYTRNKVRHLVIPLLKEINPSIEATLNDTAERLSDINFVFTSLTESLRKKIFKKSKSVTTINISQLYPFLNNNAVLFELFRPYGTGSGTLTDLRNVIKGKTGGQLFTDTHRIIKNRKEILISVRLKQDEGTSIINSIKDLRKSPYIKSVRIISISGNFSIPVSPEIACIDLESISFPLTARKWHHGDFFHPLGMKQKKKLSDYFIDRKFSVLEKERTLILESGGRIVWIIGERLDDRFRITELTKKALIIKVQGTGRRAQGAGHRVNTRP